MNFRKKLNKDVVDGLCKHLSDEIKSLVKRSIVLIIFVMENLFLDQLFTNSDYKKLIVDVIDKVLFDIDMISHLAEPASPSYYLKNPLGTLETKYKGTKNILGFCLKKGERIIFAR